MARKTGRKVLVSFKARQGRRKINVSFRARRKSPSAWSKKAKVGDCRVIKTPNGGKVKLCKVRPSKKHPSGFTFKKAR